MSDDLDKLEQNITAATHKLEEVLEGAPPERTRKGRVVVTGIKTLVGLLVLMILLPPFYQPVRGVRTSGYFFRRRPETELFTDMEFHKGIDFGAPEGTTVGPTAPGFVDSTGWSDSLGNFIIIRHLFGLKSVYGHLSKIDVAEGRLVLPGFSTIGLVGSTGRATGPHLHFEIKAGNLSLPPGPFLFFNYLQCNLFAF